jgi:anti-anti-sigma factor
MAELAPVPPLSRSRTASAELRLESDRRHPPVSGRATARPARDAGPLPRLGASPSAVRRPTTPYRSRPVCEVPRGPQNSPPGHSEGPNGELAISIGRSLGTVVVTLVGSVDTPAAPRLAATLSDLIDGQGNLAIAVDLSAVRRVGASGLQVLSDAAFDLERRGGRLSLCEARQGVLDALRLAGLGRFIGGPVVEEVARRTSPGGSGRASRSSTRRAAPDHPAGSGRERNPPGGRNDRA